MYLFFDIGGTKMRLAVSKSGKKLDGIEMFSTPDNFYHAMKLIEKIAQILTNGKLINFIVVGAPGPMDKKNTKILNSPNLLLWNGKPLKKTLGKIFKCPVQIENDANLAGLGEAIFGAGRGHKVVAFFTISTGVGGTLIVDGKINKSSSSAEPGHQIIKIDDVQGHLEGLVSGTALKRRYKIDPAKIKNKKVWDKTAEYLAYGLHNSIVHWTPGVIVLGGSVMKSLPISRVHFHLKKIMKVFPKIPEIKKGELGDLAGLYGGLALLKSLKK